MHEALLAEIYQVQSAIGQMTGYPEVETGGRGGYTDMPVIVKHANRRLLRGL